MTPTGVIVTGKHNQEGLTHSNWASLRETYMFSLIFFVCGIFSFALAYLFYRDYYRRLIIFGGIYSSSVYAFVPLGFALIFLGAIGLFPYPHPIGIVFGYLMIFSVILGAIFSITMPLFLTPFWFRILREKYSNYNCLIFFDEAAKHYDEWLERTQTPKGLEEWAEDVVKKRFGHRFAKQ